MHLTFDRVIVFLGVLLAVGAVLWTGLMLLMAWGILRPPRMSAGKAIYHLRRLSPGDLGLAYEEQPFTVRDTRSGQKLNLAAWWIPASVPSDKCVVLIHGYGDAKVGSIAWAPPLHQLNLNILAIDLRAHGDSDGRFCTGGVFEREDVDQLIDQLLNLYPDQTRQLILFGASLGAAVASGVASQRADIAAIILESPILDYKKAIAAQIKLMGLPGGTLLRTAMWCAQRISGATFDEARAGENLLKITCPTLIIVGDEDQLLEAQDFAQLEQMTRAHPAWTYAVVEQCGHLQAMAIDPAGYEQRIRDFLT